MCWMNSRITECVLLCPGSLVDRVCSAISQANNSWLTKCVRRVSVKNSRKISSQFLNNEKHNIVLCICALSGQPILVYLAFLDVFKNWHLTKRIFKTKLCDSVRWNLSEEMVVYRISKCINIYELLMYFNTFQRKLTKEISDRSIISKYPYSFYKFVMASTLSNSW